jgi:hypothetical protein
MLDRRQLLIGTFGGLLGGLALPRRSVAQPAIVPLGSRVSLVTSGTNVVTFVAADGLVLVDSGGPDGGDALVESLRRLSPEGRVRRKTLEPTRS